MVSISCVVPGQLSNVPNFTFYAYQRHSSVRGLQSHTTLSHALTGTGQWPMQCTYLLCIAQPMLWLLCCKIRNTQADTTHSSAAKPCIHNNEDGGEELQPQTSAQLGFSRSRGAHPEWQLQGTANESGSTTLVKKARTAKGPQHTNSAIHRDLQHSTPQQQYNTNDSNVIVIIVRPCRFDLSVCVP
jgi:hypothetical protein